MSTELDPFFAALRRDADRMPATAPAEVRRLGTRRRRRTALLSVAAVFAVVAGGLVALEAGVPHEHPRPAETPTITVPTVTAPAETEPPPTFAKLAPVGPGIAVGRDREAWSGTVATRGDRAFVSTRDNEGQTSVVAVDLLTGRAAWGPVPLGIFHDVSAVVWHPRYVLAYGRQDNGTRPDGTIFTLDPDTGRILLRVDVGGFESDDIVFSDSTLVIASRQDGQTRGYDLATGQVQWTVPDPPSGIVHSLPMESGAGLPAAAQRTTAFDVQFAVGTFLQLTADGTVLVRDLATGAERIRRTGLINARGADRTRDDTTAVDGILYVISRLDSTRIRATDLTRPAATETVFTTEPGDTAGNAFACGPALLCFAELRSGKQSFAAVDTRTRTVRWRNPAGVDGLHAVDGQVLINTYDQPAVIYDAGGRQLLKNRSAPLSAGWVTSGSALLFDRSPTEPRIDVLGLGRLDGDPVPLGTIQSSGLSCGWSRTHLACITDKGIKVWRFAT